MWVHTGADPLRSHRADPVPVHGLMSDVWIGDELVEDMKVISGVGCIRLLGNKKRTVKVVRPAGTGHFRVVGARDDSRIVSFLKG